MERMENLLLLRSVENGAPAHSAPPKRGALASGLCVACVRVLCGAIFFLLPLPLSICRLFFRQSFLSPASELISFASVWSKPETERCGWPVRAEMTDMMGDTGAREDGSCVTLWSKRVSVSNRSPAPQHPF